MTDAKPPSKLRRFVDRWEMVFHAVTLTFFGGALILVVLLFPDVSNLWVSIFVLLGSFTTAVTAMIAAIKTRSPSGQ